MSSPGCVRFNAHIRRPWIGLSELRVTSAFPQTGVSKGQTVLVFPRVADDCTADEGERCRITRVDRKRNRIKVKPA